MGADDFLHKVHQDLLPSSQELDQLSSAINAVEGALDRFGGALRIAERYRCGSFEKSTMLRGRQEADLVLVMADAPTAGALDRLAEVLQRGLQGRLRAAPTPKFKAVELRFADGSNVDVLPVGAPNLSAAYERTPEQFRLGLDGRTHTEWFKRAAHNTPIHPTVLLLKKLRDRTPEWEPLASFAVEVLAVRELQGKAFSGLARPVEAVVRSLASGAIGRGGRHEVLSDPARPSNDLLRGVTGDQRAAIQRAATRHVLAIEADSWSQLFPSPGRSVPPAGQNSGGRTLG